MPKISQIDEVPCQAEVQILQKTTLKFATTARRNLLDCPRVTLIRVKGKSFRAKMQLCKHPVCKVLRNSYHFRFLCIFTSASFRIEILVFRIRICDVTLSSN